MESSSERRSRHLHLNIQTLIKEQALQVRLYKYEIIKTSLELRIYLFCGKPFMRNLNRKLQNVLMV